MNTEFNQILQFIHQTLDDGEVSSLYHESYPSDLAHYMMYLAAADGSSQFYKNVGISLIAADYNATSPKIDNYICYIQMLQDYINQNDKFKLHDWKPL